MYIEANKLQETQVYKQVKKFGTGSHIILPKAWLGRTVLVQLVEPTESEEKSDYLSEPDMLEEDGIGYFAEGEFYEFEYADEDD